MYFPSCGIMLVSSLFQSLISEINMHVHTQLDNEQIQLWLYKKNLSFQMEGICGYLGDQLMGRDGISYTKINDFLKSWK